ncbi:MAG: SRPBCC domain-containing protein [Bryobacteraceae bacterium]|nr:SRPBCC domain-containing protein [Bryobacteraceae bacterium]
MKQAILWPVLAMSLSAQGPSFVNEAAIPAPVDAVWRVFTTSEGYRALGVAKAEVDLRVGGLIRTHYQATGVLGDEGTIVNRILAYEPGRMLAIRIDQPPKGFPFAEAWKATWSVIHLSDLGDRRTLVRIASLGYGEDKESMAMRRFFEVGNEATLKTLQRHFGQHPVAENPVTVVQRPAQTKALIFEVMIPAAAGAVWQAFTTSEGLRTWLAPNVTVDLRNGGEWTVHFPGGSTGGGTILNFTPERELTLAALAPDQFPTVRAERTQATFEFMPKGNSTLVRLTQTGWKPGEEWDRAYAYLAQGNRQLLETLRRRFVSGPINFGKQGGQP